jgi:hypothetical protein
MNSKRRAELQRRLSMGAVPRPPAGLAERIKAEIPKYLDATPVPQRFAWGTTMRIAATLITLLTTALVTMELIEPAKKEAVESSARLEKVTPAVWRYQTQPQAAPQQPAESEVSLDIAQDVPRPAMRMAAPRQVAAPEGAATGMTSGEHDRENGEAVAAAPVMQLAEAVHEAVPPPPPPPPAMTAPAPAPQRIAAGAARDAAREEISAYASAPAIAPPQAPQPAAALSSRVYPAAAPQNALHAAPQGDVFGISLDPAAFPAVRSAIESGARPSPGTVNVEALVNYFAGAQSSHHDVGLEVEASPAPIAMEGDVALLRFSVDTARIDVSDRAATPPVARDAHLHIDIDSGAVASFRRIGDSASEQSEEALLYNTSVTGLYELKLKPNLRTTQRIATVRLQYVSAKNGRKQTISHTIHGADLAKTWDRASRRHRLAALGAIWSETLKGTVGGVEVAKRAEELATQNPQDTRARELATAASLSTGGER